jgi:hypothetical protein
MFVRLRDELVPKRADDGELDPERGNVNNCALDGVLRRDSLPLETLPSLNQVTGGATLHKLAAQRNG